VGTDLQHELPWTERFRNLDDREQPIATPSAQQPDTAAKPANDTNQVVPIRWSIAVELEQHTEASTFEGEPEQIAHISIILQNEDKPCSSDRFSVRDWAQNTRNQPGGIRRHGGSTPTRLPTYSVCAIRNVAFAHSAVSMSLPTGASRLIRVDA
jgi:hypothetical protein